LEKEEEEAAGSTSLAADKLVAEDAQPTARPPESALAFSEPESSAAEVDSSAAEVESEPAPPPPLPAAACKRLRSCTSIIS
jgi:hypothetical protein